MSDLQLELDIAKRVTIAHNRYPINLIYLDVAPAVVEPLVDHPPMTSSVHEYIQKRVFKIFLLKF